MRKLSISLFSLGLTLAWGMALATTDKNKESSATVNYTVEKHLDEGSYFTLGMPVFTSPFLGIRSKFDASDLIVNVSTMNEDLRFLEEQQKLNLVLKEKHMPPLDRPLVEISGDVVGQGFWSSSYQGEASSDVNLTNARFDVFARVSSWAMGYISTDFDNNPLDPASEGSGFRLGNSRIFLKRAFLTIGDLDKSPVYFSLGQMYVPFGRYSTSTVTTPDTLALGQTNTRAALLGVSYQGFFAAGYVFRGDSDTDDDSFDINNWGLNAGYKYRCDPIGVEVGGGYIANLADSNGMQITGNHRRDQFSGFGESHQTEVLVHKVPGMDMHLEFDYGKFGIDTEYIAATRHFAFQDMFYNNHGAKPTAFHIEANYTYTIADRPSSVAIAYEQTTQALALRLPRRSLIGTFNVSIWKNTIESLEYRYDENYHSHDRSGGQAVAIEDTTINGNPVEEGTLILGGGPRGGGHRNMIVAQIGVYF